VTTWIKTDVRRLIVEAVAPVVGPGFRFQKRSDAFVRTIDGGRQELGLPLYDFNPVFEFSLTLCIRLDTVQEITNRFSGSPPKYHGATLTSVTQLEFLGLAAVPGRGVLYRAASASELAEVLPAVLTIVRERVLPFFDEFRTVGAVNRGLNPAGAERMLRLPDAPDRRSFDATNMPYRAMTGVAVAHLARDPRLTDLVVAYRAQISAMPEHDRRKFETLVAFLVPATS
jgi:hypothetical protein